MSPHSLNPWGGGRGAEARLPQRQQTSPRADADLLQSFFLDGSLVVGGKKWEVVLVRSFLPSEAWLHRLRHPKVSAGLRSLLL